jgi:thiamine-monophosphate kinase
MNEFSIIEHFFNQQKINRQDVIVGIGDDCAIVHPPINQELLITTDTLVNEVHFLKNTSAYDIGFKALAVNLSDLAAKGAEPAWITGALTLPAADEQWLKEFASGLFELANRYHVQLIGGDLTKGPLTITLQAIGFAPSNQAIRRNGAKVGDLIYVTNTLGDAALGLAYLKNIATIPNVHREYFITRLNRPEPRIEVGKKLRGIAHASIDISDGLAADLQHILKNSHVGAIVYIDKLPLSKALYEAVPLEDGIVLALTGGDDYELCFTLPPEKVTMLSFECTCIGEIVAPPGLDLRYQNGNKYQGNAIGYKHFY